MTLDSEFDEQENVPDHLLGRYENVWMCIYSLYFRFEWNEQTTIVRNWESNGFDLIGEFRCIKEIEWWNEITPWKNSESKKKIGENYWWIFRF